MKLEKILDNLNSLEKNSFIKIIDNIIANNPKNFKAIDKILAETDNSELKNLDNVVITKIFSLIESEFSILIKNEFINTSSQIDILIDIVIRDGNCIMRQYWFTMLDETELINLSKKIKGLQKDLENPKSEISEQRKRDYKLYKSCVNTAYFNDVAKNREPKITDDESSILITLAHEMELSQEAVKLINYMIISVNKMDTDNVINNLKNIGVIFYSRKSSTLFIADEMVRVLRKIREKEIADKFFRRILRVLREPQINLVCKKHNISTKLPIDRKIKEIINEGVSFTSVLTSDVHKDGSSISDRKKFLNDLWSKNLNLTPGLKGTTLQEKIAIIIAHFESIEKDEKVGISIDGYEKLLLDISETLPKINDLVKLEFELQDENVLQSSLLLNYNFKPRDILDIIHSKDLERFIKVKGIKSRGNNVDNILNAYKDSENLYFENFVNIGFRDLNALKENGIRIKEAELGLKFEELTKSIFKQLGFNVDEKLKRELNTKKDKIDIVLNLDNNEIIIVECKSVKESGYNKFSSVSRQLKSYVTLAQKKDYKVIKSLLIAPEFSDDFINETELEYDLHLSLIKAGSLIKILDGFKSVKNLKQFPYKLLLRDVLIQEGRIIKAIGK